jgi:hypothetical protein
VTALIEDIIILNIRQNKHIANIIFKLKDAQDTISLGVVAKNEPSFVNCVLIVPVAVDTPSDIILLYYLQIK